MLTQWKRNVHKNLWDDFLLIISALTKTESFLVHSFHTVVSINFTKVNSLQGNLQPSIIPNTYTKYYLKGEGEKKKENFLLQKSVHLRW